ncbi:MAG: nucleotidyltransferase family protein [Candidatus Kuenenbacteria bacterium]
MTDELKKSLEAINNNLENLGNLYNVKKIGIFGSVAQGRQTKKSDVDILVEFSQPVSFFKFIDLEDKLSTMLKKKVDLATKKALKPIIKKQILKEIVYAQKKH